MPSRYLLILFAAFLFAGCSATTELAELPPATEFERVVYGVPVVDADGRAYDHPWLGGLDVPRPQLVDIDGDGDKDLFLQEFTGKVMFFEADSAGGFTWKSDAYEGLDVGDWFRFADLDQDGDIDLLGEQRFSYVKAFENVGSPTAPQFVLRTDTLLGASGDPIFAERQNILNLVDLDCDQKLDLFIGMLTGTITRYESVSAAGELPRFELVTENFEGIEIIGEEGLSAELPRGSLHGANTLAFHDVDADGDQDLFWGDYFEPG
ncbi:MAG: VCBS repeat-containing protein, partial [Bacteroidota bacterium]